MIKFELKGKEIFEREAKKIAKLKDSLPQEIANIMNRFGLRVWSTSAKKYLSGPRPEKLAPRTGLLRSSIRYKITKDRKAVNVTFGTSVPYAAIHEFGGTTSAHTIVPKKALALKFMVGGKVFFAKKVNHPGSTIKPRPFLKPSVMDNMDSLKDDLNGIFSRLYGK